MSAVEEQRMDVDEHRESEEQNEGRQSEDNVDELIMEEDPNATREQIENAQKDDPVPAPEPEHENDESEEQVEDAETADDDEPMEEDAAPAEEPTGRRTRPARAAATVKAPPAKKAPAKKVATKSKAKPAPAAKSPKTTTPKKAEPAAKTSKKTEAAAKTTKKAEPATKASPKKTPAKAAAKKTPEAPAEEKPKRTSGRAKADATPAKTEPQTPSKGRGGARKRKVSENEGGETSTTAVKRIKSERAVKPRFLSIEKFQPTELGVRVLTCGEGEQLGHPGRTTTRKPRAVDTLPEGISIRQVVAGGVHTVVLTDDYVVYSCGINEGGTVPVKGLASEETTDELTIIEFPPELETKEGRIVQLTTGAGFTAALTEKGSVIAWGNLRDDNGAVDVHHLFAQMRKGPTVIISHKNVVIVKIKAGENHLVMLSEDGEVYTFGEGSHGQLGSSARTKHIRSGYMADDKHLKRAVLEKGKFLKFTDIFAGGFWTMAHAEDGRIFVCGLNNYGQLGIPLPSDLKSEGAEGDDLEEQNRRLIVDRLTPSPAFAADKKWTHIGGVKHTIARNEDGEIYGIGLNTDNELGLGTYQGKDDQEHWRYLTHQRIELPEGVKIAGIAATLGATIAWTDNGDAYAFGYDSVGQLGLGIKDDENKSVATPKKISSAHLEGFKIISVSIADNHAVFLAAKNDSDDAAEE